MESESDPINEYKSSLNELSFNSKPLINMLTMLSEDYKDSKAPEIVKCIEHRINTVANDKKLPILYLLDSICKNVGHIYVRLFTQNIVSTFCDVFEKVDEKTRLSLYKLRQTWSSIFAARKLYAIDARIHNTLDPAWPITAPKPDTTATPAATVVPPKPVANNSKPVLQSVVKQTTAGKGPSGLSGRQQQVHINPKFFNDVSLQSPTIATVGPEAELAKQLIQKQNELLQLQKQKLELEMMSEKRKLAEHARALQEKELKLKQKEHQMLRSNSPNGKKINKKRKRSRSHRSRSPSPISPKSRSPNHRWSQSPNERLRDSPQPMNRQQSPSYALRHPNAHRPRSRSPSAVNKSQFIPQQNVVPMTQIQPSIVSHSSNLMPMSANQPPVPTTIPAPTILAQPEMLNISRMDANVVTTMSSIRPMSTPMSGHNVHPGIRPNNNDRQLPSWGQDRDYRKEFDSMINEAHEKLRSGAITSADHDVLVREVERQLMDTQNKSFGVNNNKNNIVICEPQDTFTMLVDGKHRKLFYLDDTTAVVLLNAPQNAVFDQLIQIDPKLLDPRKISFEGKPTKVFFDSDRGSHDFVILEFNEQQKTFFPNDSSVPQRIKFGGPAKEIILNGQSYAVKFGGPPITVWFEGDNNSHTLKLDGPTPRVKLSDERRYDLWNKIIEKATSEAKSATNIAPVVPKPSDINTLLSKLIAAGMIDNNTTQSTDSSKITSNETKPEIKVEPKVEKTLSTDPPVLLTSDSLKQNRPSVVAALYNGIQCTNCSLRFDDRDEQISGDKTRYSKHLDWHFRQNRRDKTKPNSTATSMRRNWYYPLNLWVQFKEVTDEEDTTGLFQTEEDESDVEEEIPESSVIAEKDESLNCCAVCGEKFDQNWNEEEEEWRLKNAVKHNHKIYHPFCLNDFIAQNERLEQMSREQELNDSGEGLGGGADPVMHSTIDLIVDSVNKLKNSELFLKMEVKEHMGKSDAKCDSVLTQELSESEVKSELNIEEMETNVSEVSLKEEEKPELSESTEESNIKVFEFEIPLNCDKEVVQELMNSLEPKDVEPTETVEEKKVVVQQTGGIVIKMKASNLPAQTPVVPTEPIETTQKKEPEVIVRGQEISSLCNIL